MGDWMQEDPKRKKKHRKQREESQRAEEAEKTQRKTPRRDADEPEDEADDKRGAIQAVLDNATPVTEADDWPEPDTGVISDHLHPAPPLPLAAFGAWSGWIKDAAEAKCAPMDYVAMALLSGASSLICNVRWGAPWESWQEPTIIWGALIGLPSSNKSTPLDIIIKAIRAIEAELAEEYQEKLDEYKKKVETARIHREHWESECKKALKAHEEPPEKPEAANEPECPPRPRLCISDITIEKAAEVAMQNPRGLLLYRDELAGMLGNMERRGGSDREFWIEAYGARPCIVDRKKYPEGYTVPHLSIVIVGSTQPDKVVKMLIEAENDGLAARFLPVWPEPVPVPPHEPQAMVDEQKLLKAFKRLYFGLPFFEGEPEIIPFTESAKAVFLEWRVKQPERERGMQGILLALVGKMPGMVIRLAAVLSDLDWAASQEVGHPEAIEKKYVRRAVALVDDYFIPMAKRTLGEQGLPQRQLDSRIIAYRIVADKSISVNARLLRRQRVLPTQDTDRYDAALKYLEECDWLRDAGERKGGTPGRRKKTYKVNPCVHMQQ